MQGSGGFDAADGGFGRGSLRRLVGVLAFEVGEDFLGAVEDLGGDAGQAGDVDAVALVGASGDDLVQEDDVAFLFADGDVGVFEAGLGVLEVGEFVVVGGEEGAAADAVVQVLGDGPGEGDAVEGAGAAADLVEDDEALRRWRC